VQVKFTRTGFLKLKKKLFILINSATVKQCDSGAVRQCCGSFKQNAAFSKPAITRWVILAKSSFFFLTKNY
jgi:hypothetical protein